MLFTHLAGFFGRERIKTQKACEQGWEANIGPKITSI